MSVSPATRRFVLERDGHACVYCGRSVFEEPMTLDHVVPRSDGGSDRPENLVAACAPCNHGRGARPLDAETLARLPVRGERRSDGQAAQAAPEAPSKCRRRPWCRRVPGHLGKCFG